MDKHYDISDFARRIGRSASTVRRWERDGLLTSKRLPSGHGQKDDLQSQVAAMEQYCLGAGIAVNEWVQEIGGGMNFKCKRFLALMDRIAAGDISRLIVAHKDRLVRFGFDLLDHITKPIPKADADLTEAQMMLYALKDGMDPDCTDAKHRYREMRKAVKEHNENFPAPEPYRGEAPKLSQAKRQKEKQK